ncbi:hypothetical protein E2C01_021088 [Portunus trituberculatus]|uniref:Uncharacterized protein n=1 Tax=Portunus trituberculatus TaxID=210409 RepID=A0A5B7E3A3_PORTR|nr:hypothetical protein [Portunus trituberculatus]
MSTKNSRCASRTSMEPHSPARQSARWPPTPPTACLGIAPRRAPPQAPSPSSTTRKTTMRTRSSSRRTRGGSHEPRGGGGGPGVGGNDSNNSAPTNALCSLGAVLMPEYRSLGALPR